MRTTLVSKSISAPRILAGVVALVTMFSSLLADFVVHSTAAQHLRNDAWPPHAKFHDAQYIVMSIVLGAVALTLLVSRWRSTRFQVWIVSAFLATPWLGLLGAGLFPGTAVHDPEFDNGSILGLEPQMLLAVVQLVLLLGAVLLAARTGEQ